MHWLSWTRLRTWGNSRLVRTSYAWLLVVPMVGLALGSAGSAPLTLRLGEQIELRLILPFHWLVFYVTMVCLAGGHALYVWRCPQVVRRYANFNAYRADHLGITHLVQVVGDLVRRMDARELDRFHLLMHIALQIDQESGAEGDRILEETAAMPNFTNRMRLFDWYRDMLLRAPHEGLVSDAFDVVLEHAGRLHRGSMLLSSLLLRLGALGLLLIVAQCAWSVVGLVQATPDRGLWSVLFPAHP